MSEYVDRLAVDRLIGGSLASKGLLTAKIREQPFSVVLLDELEKGAPVVLRSASAGATPTPTGIPRSTSPVQRQLLLPLGVDHFCRFRSSWIEINDGDACRPCRRRLRGPKRGGKRAASTVTHCRSARARFPCRRAARLPGRPGPSRRRASGLRAAADKEHARGSRRRLELPQFRGHLILLQGGGIRDVENQTAVPGGVPTADGRAWFGPDVRPGTWLGSSSRPPRPSEPGSRRRTEMSASAPTARAPKSMKRFVGCAARTGGCAKNAKFWQKPRPGLRGRPDPGRSTGS